jgi:DNA-binding GntR family transcriptional regulator
MSDVWVRSSGGATHPVDAQGLDRESPIPLWFQIAEMLRLAIESGKLHPGERLENEMELSERFGVSRPTVRQAVQALVQKDLVVRRRGVGTTVANRRINRPVALTSLYDDLVASGRKPSTKVLLIEERGAEPQVATKLGIDAGAPVVCLQRVRFAEGAPLALMINTIPVGVLAAPLGVEDLEAAGLYQVLRGQGIRFNTASETIGARTATNQEARLLAIPRSTTMLVMARTAWDPSGSAIEFGSHSYLASRYAFEISLSLK